jgi:hypothetical protein
MLTATLPRMYGNGMQPRRPAGKFAPAMSVYATPEQRARLARLNELTKVPQSEIIREGLAMALDAREEQLRRQGIALPPLVADEAAPTAAG